MIAADASTNSLPQLTTYPSSQKVYPTSRQILRIFLIQTALGLFNTSGGYKANHYLLSFLSSQGHACISLVLCWKNDILAAGVNYIEEKVCFDLEKDKVRVYRFIWGNVGMIGLELEDYLKIFPRSSISNPLEDDKESATEYNFYLHFIKKEIMTFRATHFIFNDSVALKIASTLPSSITRIFICHACEHLSFGPYGGVPGFGSTCSPVEHKWLKEIEGVWSVSRAVKRYIDIYGEGISSTYLPLHPATYGQPPFKRYYNFDAPYVIIINPGAIKGYTIFKEIVEKMRDVQFAAVKSWSVNDYLLNEMKKLDNVTIFQMFENMEELWPKVKVLLVPSIWYEAFGLVVVEAMLRGIPVICSDAGGLPEAKCGVEFGTIHVNVTNGERETDLDAIKKMGIYKIPQQDVEPWIRSLRYLINDRETYERFSQECCDKANVTIENIDVGIYKRWLLDIRKNQLLNLDNLQKNDKISPTVINNVDNINNIGVIVDTISSTV
nr:14493_t:CDS:2 [Entrophospora candida]